MQNEQKPKKNRAAVSLGRKGGYARARILSKERASEIGRKAAAVRWKDHLTINQVTATLEQYGKTTPRKK